MEMKEDVKQTLISPSDIILVLFVKWMDLVDEMRLSHTGQIHEHHSGIEAEFAVIGVSSESVVPAHVFVFVFGRKSR